MDDSVQLSRRSLLTGAAGAGGVVLLGGAYNADASAAVLPSQRISLRQSFGVQIHSNYMGSLWADYDRVFRCVLRTGATHVRDYLRYPANDLQQGLWRRFRRAGIKVFATMGSYGQTRRADRPELFHALLQVADCVDMVAGWNEPDGGREDWLAPTVRHQKWLYRKVKGHRATRHIKVAMAPLRGDAPPRRYRHLYRRARGAYDVKNLHVYPRGGPPEDYLASMIRLLPRNNKPLVISEGGYNTGLGIKTGGNPVTQREQARYLKRFLEVAARRGARLYVYNLLDMPDPDWNDWSAHWGLYNAHYEPKRAVRRLARAVS